MDPRQKIEIEEVRRLRSYDLNLEDVEMKQQRHDRREDEAENNVRPIVFRMVSRVIEERPETHQHECRKNHRSHHHPLYPRHPSSEY